MERSKTDETMKELAVLIVMTELAAIWRTFDCDNWGMPVGATESQARAVRKHIENIHNSLGEEMDFDFTALPYVLHHDFVQNQSNSWTNIFKYI